jgi:ATP-binding cassette subfamily B protein
VLRDISFDVRRKETLAVVGPTGAGKTSLINLFIRLYDPDSGRITMNGTDIKEIDKRSLRSRIALVNQDPFLFSGSIRDNILSGKSEEEGYSIEKILDIANCRSFVDKLPDGVDTILSAGAGTLSSGERQLLSIARAIAGNPDLIILDEATSYIDTESEVRIQEALDNLMVSRTSVIIAHRLSTAKHADTILVMNRRQIVESGKHDDLMAKKGLYWKLTTVQNSSEDRSAVRK